MITKAQVKGELNGYYLNQNTVHQVKVNDYLDNINNGEYDNTITLHTLTKILFAHQCHLPKSYFDLIGEYADVRYIDLPDSDTYTVDEILAKL